MGQERRFVRCSYSARLGKCRCGWVPVMMGEGEENMVINQYGRHVEERVKHEVSQVLIDLKPSQVLPVDGMGSQIENRAGVVGYWAAIEAGVRAIVGPMPVYEGKRERYE